MTGVFSSNCTMNNDGLSLLSSTQLTKAYQIANVLFDVLKAVNMTKSIEVDQEVGYFLWLLSFIFCY